MPVLLHGNDRSGGLDRAAPRRAVLRHLDESIAMLGDPIGDPLTVPNALCFAPMLLAEVFGDGQDPRRGGERYARTHVPARAPEVLRRLPKMLSSDVRAAIADRVPERELTPLFADQRWSQFVAKLMAIWMLGDIESWLRSVSARPS